MGKSVLIDDNAFLRKTLCKIAIEEDLDVMCVVRQRMDVMPSRGSAITPRLDHLESFNARDERFGCGPCAEAFAAERTTDYVQRFR